MTPSPIVVRFRKKLEYLGRLVNDAAQQLEDRVWGVLKGKLFEV